MNTAKKNVGHTLIFLETKKESEILTSVVLTHVRNEIMNWDVSHMLMEDMSMFVNRDFSR